MLVMVGVCSGSQIFLIDLVVRCFSRCLRRAVSSVAVAALWSSVEDLKRWDHLYTQNLLDLWKNPTFLTEAFYLRCCAQGLPNGSLSRWSFSRGGRRRRCETNEGPVKGMGSCQFGVKLR